MSYHDGSVWPHDNALIVMGMSHYGLGANSLPISRRDDGSGGRGEAQTDCPSCTAAWSGPERRVRFSIPSAARRKRGPLVRSS
jgi:hypothetical protein